MLERKRTAIHGIATRPIRAADVTFSARLNASENWMDTLWDIRRLMRCEPQGFMMAELQGRPVGQILSIAYGKLGWIGFLIVLREHRGKGIGSALVREAIAYLKESNVETIYLDANPLAVDLYQRLGFEHEFKTWKFARVNEHIRITDLTPVEAMSGGALREVCDFDKRFFLGDRSRVLGEILVDNRDFSYVIRDRRELKGFVMCRPTRTGFRVGPLVCDPSTTKIAETLLAIAMNAMPVGTKVSLSAPDSNPAHLDLLSRYGFERGSHNLRMCLGKKQNLEPAMGIMALAGLEKG